MLLAQRLRVAESTGEQIGAGGDMTALGACLVSAWLRVAQDFVSLFLKTWHTKRKGTNTPLHYNTQHLTNSRDLAVDVEHHSLFERNLAPSNEWKQSNLLTLNFLTQKNTNLACIVHVV